MRPHGAGTLVLLAFAARACGSLRARTAPASSAEEALLTRRIERLKKLVARGAAGSPLVDLRQAMVGDRLWVGLAAAVGDAAPTKPEFSTAAKAES